MSNPCASQIRHRFATIAFAFLAALPTAASAVDYTLTVTRNGSTSGFAVGSFSCFSPTCAYTVAEGTEVFMGGASSTGHFAGWSGCDSIHTNYCNVTVNSDRTITATFNTNTTTNEPVQSVIGAGNDYTCMLSTSGGVKCMGRNNQGQLGNGDATLATQGQPVDVVGLTSGVIDIAIGRLHACALTSVGGVKCWGLNSSGQLGDGTTTTPRTSPVDVVGLQSGVVKISAGFSHTCALLAAGGMRCWGSNSGGEVGDNTTTQRNFPVDVSGLPEIVTAIGTGASHTCALTQGGAMKCWGRNSDGQVGDATTTQRNVPTAVSGLSSGVTAMALGNDFTCAVVGGAAKCWGTNFYGSLGDGTNTAKNVPTDVVGLASGVDHLTAGQLHGCAAMSAGNLKCWGYNGLRELGDGTATNRNSPVDVLDVKGGVMKLVAGGDHTCAHTNAGRVICWGNWTSPAGANVQLFRPTHIRELGGVSSIDAAFAVACASTSTGARCWGSGSYTVGDGTNNQRNAPVEVQELNVGTAVVSMGDLMACAITNSGGVKCWGTATGNSANVGIGDGAIGGRANPVDITGLSSGITSLSAGYAHGCAVQSGSVKCWGDNFSGARGTGDLTSPLTPNTVAGIGGAVQVASGQYHTCALLNTGAVRCWGRNSRGQLGDGTGTDSNTPVTPTGLTTGIVALAAGYEHTCVLSNAGAVSCFGSNLDRQSGGPNNSSFMSPTAIASLSASVAAIYSGGNHSCAKLLDGSVKCWGFNNQGQLGDGTTTTTGTPVTVTSLGSDVQSLAIGFGFSCALTWSGTVRCWGENSQGQLGNNTTTSSTTPAAGGILGQALAFNPPSTIAPATPLALTSTTSSGLVAMYETWNANCSIASDALTLNSGGRCGVLARQPGSGPTFAAPTQLRFTGATGLSTQAITITTNLFDRSTNSAAFTIAATGGASGNPVTFSSLTPTVCTSTGTNGSTISMTPLGGTCTIAADQAGNATYLPAAQATRSFNVTVVNFNLTVDRNGTGTGTVTGSDINCGATCVVNRPFGTVFTLTATPNAGSVFTAWSFCNSVAGNVCTVTLNTNRFPRATFNLEPQPQTINWNPDPLPAQSVTNYQYFFQVTTSSGLAVTSVVSLTPAVCDGGGTGATFLNAPGTCTLRATQAGNATWAPVISERSFQVTAPLRLVYVQKNGTGSGYVSGGDIDCGDFCFRYKPSGTVYALTATPGSGSRFVQWSGCDSVTGNVCNLTVGASDAYLYATFDTPAPQTITFPPINDRGIAQTPFTVSASSDSGLAVTIASNTAPVCTISGNSVSLHSLGTCELVASQAGNEEWAPASVTRTFQVSLEAPPEFVVQARYRLGENDPGSVGTPGAAVTVANPGTVNLAKNGATEYVNGVHGIGLGMTVENGSYNSPSHVSMETDNFGVEAWVKASAASGSGTIAYVGHGGFSGYGLIVDNTQVVGLYGGVDVIHTNGNTPLTTEWTHYALVRAGGETRIYKNGVAVSDAWLSGPAPASVNGTTIGNFPGAVDEVRFFRFLPGAFEALDLNVRKLTVVASGTGSVSSTVGDINCGVACVAHFPIMSVITLTAVPDAGSTFTGWSGGGCSGTSPCTVTLEDSTTVTAVFGAAPAGPAKVRDLSGEGRSDILLRGPNGEVVAWLMNGSAVSSATLMLGAGTGYQATHFGDFNGDGKMDLLVVGPTGQLVVWLMNGSSVSSATLVLAGGSGYSVDKLGDFNGDGKTDILFRGAAGNLILWLMNGASVASSGTVLGAGTGFAPVATGDFNDDGKDDVVLAHTDGRVTIWLMNGTAIASSANVLGAGTGYTVSHVGDFNNDGKTDLLFKGASGQIVLWRMNGTAVLGATLLYGGGPYLVSHVADVNGDGFDDIVLKGPAGQIVIWRMNGASIEGATLMYGGGAFAISHVGDYNGDGMDDLLIKGPNGEIVVWIMNGTSITSAALLLGATTYQAAP